MTFCKCVYLLRSLSDPTKKYVGSTSNLQRRLEEHNNGKTAHTSRFMPWEIVTAIYFTDAKKAEAFEKYLKSGSGHAFANKRLV